MSGQTTATPADAAPAEPAAPPLTLLQHFFRFSERFGHMMSRILLTLLYVTLVAPAGFVISRFGDPLAIKRWRGTSWNAWTQKNDTLARARRQD